jgi:hypothetical protein
MACRASDAAHAGCPARMQDGRMFTDYRSRCDVHLDLVGGEGSFEMRQRAIRDGEQLLARQRSVAFSRARCAPCVAPYDRGTMLPERDAVTCDRRTCRRVALDADGWGTGRLYGEAPEQGAARASLLSALGELQSAPAPAGCGPAPF